MTLGGVANVMRERLDRQVAVRAALVSADRPAENEKTSGPKTVMVDFTADWCLTCKTLEATVLDRAAVVEAVRRLGVVPLQADWTHGDPEVTRMLAALGAKQVPVLAIFPAGDPNHPIVLRGGYTRQMLLDALETASRGR
jgi:thiol:disulfide interchange protein